MKNVTIRDVARHAGVAPATVSRVINNSGYVSPCTRARVLEAVEDLGFKPNGLARSLTSGRTRTIGLVLPDITNPFFPALARGVEDVAYSSGYAVILCNTDSDPGQEKAYVHTLMEKRIDGIIFTVSSADTSAIQELIEAQYPFVLIDRRVEGVEADTVVIDNLSCAHDITLHLVRMGHRRIAHISGPLALAVSRDRQAGYLKALAGGPGVDPKLLRVGDFRFESGYDQMQELLRGPGCTAVFAANDMMAAGAIQAITDAGLDVPADIAVVGFDDILLASLIRPALTTVAQPAYEMGASAFRLLLERLAGPELPPRVRVLHPRLVVRESCGGRRWVAT
ncbi:MAG: LacI family DNA-binding transcriptional regulator [Bacillota bacterium]